MSFCEVKHHVYFSLIKVKFLSLVNRVLNADTHEVGVSVFFHYQELVESIRNPSLDVGAFNVFRSVFNPSGPQGEPLDSLFNKLNAPLLLLWGSKDPWMNTPKKRDLYKKYTPENTTEIILDAGHCPHDEIPDQVNNHILDWLKLL